MLPGRQEALAELGRLPLDVLIVGGGINGAGIARDLTLRAREAGHPLRVGLVEQRHFASGTSSRNSQLIHGGLRYLKNLEFSLVRAALRERAILLDLAPHLVEPLPFLIPMYSRFAQLFYGTGLWLYDVLAGSRSVGRRRSLSADEVRSLEPGLCTGDLTGGAVFHDCRVHSARFVLENVMDAAARGACVVNYVRMESARRDGERWSVDLRDVVSGASLSVDTRSLVDARGPWAGEAGLRLVRGSHLVLPRVNASDHAIAHFDADGRIVFLIPWGAARDLTLVGTTEADHDGSADDVRISREETAYLLGIVRSLFPAANPQPVSSYSSLRPLVREGDATATSTSREHHIWCSSDGTVHVAGGKYTTYRQMSEEAADLVAGAIAPALTSVHVTASRPLPGALRGASGELREYGSLADAVLERAPREASGGLSALDAARIRFAVECEMAQRLADVMFISTYWGYQRSWNRNSLQPYAEEMGRRHGWSSARTEEEIGLTLRIASAPEPTA